MFKQKTWLPLGVKQINDKNRCYKWVFDLLKKYHLEYIYNFNDLYKNLFTLIFTQDAINITTVNKYVDKLCNIDMVMLYFNDFFEIYTFITTHFLFDWQLYISILLDEDDESFWVKNKNVYFKHFIEEEYREIYNFDIITYNTQEVTEFLSENNANLPDTKCENIVNSMYCALKNRKNELVLKNKIKSDYIKNKWI